MSRLRNEDALEKMARGNEIRELVVKFRRERRKSVTRFVKCMVCLESTYSMRDKTDPCAACVESLWQAQDVSLAAAAADAGDGMVAVKFSARAHDFPYPHFFYGHREVPKDAAFVQQAGYRNEHVTSPNSTFQQIFHKVLVGLAEAYPLPPDFGKGMMPLFATCYDNNHQALLPQKTVAAMMELFPFVQWISQISYENGLSEGQSLLRQLNLGTITVEGFNTQIARQTESVHRAREKAEKGDIAKS